MKYIRCFGSQADLNSVYNVTPTFETISICGSNRSVYHPYMGQVGNLYKWGDSFYTAVRNPTYDNGCEILDSSGNDIGQWVEDVNERLVYAGGYDEPWVGYVANGNLARYTKSKLYTGGSILDLRDAENNPNLTPVNPPYINNPTSVVDRYFNYSLSDSAMNALGTTIQYILMDWDEDGWVYNYAGKMKVGRLYNGNYNFPGCWLNIYEGNRIHLYIND